MSACSVPCNGKCCEDFFLAYSPSELKESYEYWREQKYETGRTFLDDIWLIYPMVRLARTEQEDGKTLHYYRCTHLTVEGKCGIYENRPAMCAEYPYGRECRFCGVTAGTKELETLTVVAHGGE